MPARMSDVVIVGGGVMGSAIAYHLAQLSNGRISVTVIEKDPGYVRASSALSLGSIRQQFSTPLNIAMSRYGMSFLRDAHRTLESDGVAPDLGLTDRSYLFLGDAGNAQALAASHALQRAAGAPVELLTPGDLANEAPWLDLTGLVCATTCRAGEGWFDGYSLTQAFRRKAIALGVTYLADQVTGFSRAGDRLAGVLLAAGDQLTCGQVVNAAGPYAGRVAGWAGIQLPVRPQKRCVFVVDCPDADPSWPLVIDPSGVYFRPEGRTFLAGAPAPNAYADPDDPLDVDHHLFEADVWPVLAARAPAFERLKVLGAWAGHYEMNVLDQNGVIGRHPQISNLLFANGFSGHGMQHAPAVGLGVAELILFGAYRTLDLSELNYARLETPGHSLLEQAVV